MFLLNNLLNKKFYLAAQTQCLDNICRKCLYDRIFTESELNQTLTWLVNIQKKTALRYKLTLPKPCDSLKLRQDIYCLAQNATLMNEFIDAYTKLYLDGTILRLTSLHNRYWPAGHKTAEFNPWHRQLCYRLDLELQRVTNNPNYLLPIWVKAHDYFR